MIRRLVLIWQKLFLRFHEKGRQRYHIGYLALGKTLEELKQHLNSKWGFGNHFIAWPDDGQVLSWRKLADFYIEVFDCMDISQERHLKGKWVEIGTGVANATIDGIHLLLPGSAKNGPTLEIFQYNRNEQKSSPSKANREGLGHLAFYVDDVQQILERVLLKGGSKIGDIAIQEFKTGTLSFVYVTDPEGNIIEVQNWKSK